MYHISCQAEQLQSQSRGGGSGSRLEEWLEEKANGAELLCGRLEARVLRSEADLAQVMRSLD